MAHRRSGHRRPPPQGTSRGVLHHHLGVAQGTASQYSIILFAVCATIVIACLHITTRLFRKEHEESTKGITSLKQSSHLRAASKNRGLQPSRSASAASDSSPAHSHHHAPHNYCKTVSSSTTSSLTNPPSYVNILIFNPCK